MEIQQRIAQQGNGGKKKDVLRYYMSGNIQKKDRTFPDIRSPARPRACCTCTRKRPARCVDTIQPDTFQFYVQQFLYLNLVGL